MKGETLRWCRACNIPTRHAAGSRYLYCTKCKDNNYDLAGNPARYWEQAQIHPVHAPIKEETK